LHAAISKLRLFSSLANALKFGDVAAWGSDAYADYREQLLPWSECEAQVDEYCRELGTLRWQPTSSTARAHG
jgi:hypothetical protein